MFRFDSGPEVFRKVSPVDLERLRPGLADPAILSKTSPIDLERVGPHLVDPSILKDVLIDAGGRALEESGVEGF